MWNFFKVNDGNGTQQLKYLVVLEDRMDYDTLVVNSGELKKCESRWIKIFDEYNKLEKNFGVINFIHEQSKILYHTAVYHQERAIISSLLYRTNPTYIQFLRRRGYHIANTSQLAYHQSLLDALKHVKHHESYIESLRAAMRDRDQDAKEIGNPFDNIMAWIAASDVKVEENITVARYLRVKELIVNREKAKAKSNGRT